MHFKTLSRTTRALALLALVFTASAFRGCPVPRGERASAGAVITADEPTPTPTPYEDPADCKCYLVNGKRVCNSACPNP